MKQITIGIATEQEMKEYTIGVVTGQLSSKDMPKIWFRNLEQLEERLARDGIKVLKDYLKDIEVQW